MAGDIHMYRTSSAFISDAPLSGIWQPDGRKVDPADVLDTDPRAAMLSSFANLNANGQWTLFLADLNSGASHTLNR